MNILSVIMILAGCWIVAMNWLVAWKIWVAKEEAPSWLPIVGGALISFGLWLQPYELLSSWWWIGLLVDYGCIFGFTHTIWYWIQYLKRHSEDDSKGSNP